MTIKLCWKVDEPDQTVRFVTKDCGLIPIMVRVKCSSHRSLVLVLISKYSLFVVIFVPCLRRNSWGAMKNLKNLEDTSSSMEMNVSFAISSFLVGITSLLSTAPPSKVVVLPIHHMPFKYVAYAQIRLVLQTHSTIWRMVTQCCGLAGENKNMSCLLCFFWKL